MAVMTICNYLISQAWNRDLTNMCVSNNRVLIGQKFDKLVKNALHSKKTLKKHHVRQYRLISIGFSYHGLPRRTGRWSSGLMVSMIWGLTGHVNKILFVPDWTSLRVCQDLDYRYVRWRVRTWSGIFFLGIGYSWPKNSYSFIWAIFQIDFIGH